MLRPFDELRANGKNNLPILVRNRMKHFFSKPITWVVLLFVSAGLSFFAFRMFTKAFPIIHLNLAINRHEALHKAQELAQRYHLGPHEYSQAIEFATDTSTKTYVELEGGGVQ